MNKKEEIINLINRAINIMQEMITKNPDIHSSEKYALVAITYWKDCLIKKKNVSKEEFQNANLGFLIARNIEDAYPNLAEMLYKINEYMEKDYSK